MKIRTDFVTNSSSSCYTITLRIVNTDDITLSFEGRISEEDSGWFEDWENGDPRRLAGVSTVDELKQMLSSFSTLCNKDFDCSDDSIPLGDGNDEEFDDSDLSAVQEYWDRREQLGYDNLIQAVDICLKSPDDIKSVSLVCEGSDYNAGAEVVEQYDYDKVNDTFNAAYKAIDDGEDVTDLMLNSGYSIDCGDDYLDFQFNLK